MHPPTASARALSGALLVVEVGAVSIDSRLSTFVLYVRIDSAAIRPTRTTIRGICGSPWRGPRPMLRVPGPSPCPLPCPHALPPSPRLHHNLHVKQSLSPNLVHADVDLAVDRAWYERHTAGTDSAFDLALRAQGYHVLKDRPEMVRVCIGHAYAGGLVAKLATKPAAVKAEPYYNTHRYVDVYVMKPRAGKHVDGSGKPRSLYKIERRAHDHDDLFPLRAVRIGDMRLPFPSRPERVLTKLYGKWWEVKHTLHGASKRQQGKGDQGPRARPVSSRPAN